MRLPHKMLVLYLAAFTATPLVAETRQAALSKPAEFTLDRDETMELDLRLAAGEYLLTVDTRRVDGRISNLISKVSLLDGDGVVVRDAALSFNEIDRDFRRVSAFQLRRTATVSVRVVNSHDQADFMVVVHPLTAGFLARRRSGEPPPPDIAQDDWPFAEAKAGWMPYPFFGKAAPRPIALDEEQTGELEVGESAYYAVALPRGDYRAVLGLEQSRRKNSNLIGYVALLDSAGGSQEKIASINAIDVSYTAAGSFTMKRPTLVVLRVTNTHENTVKYTVRLRPVTE